MCGQTLKSFKFFSENRNFGPFWSNLGILVGLKWLLLGGKLLIWTFVHLNPQTCPLCTDQIESCKYIILWEGSEFYWKVAQPVSRNKAWDKHGHGLCRNDLFPASMQNGQDDYMLSTSQLFITFPFEMPAQEAWIHQRGNWLPWWKWWGWQGVALTHLARPGVSAWSQCSSPCRFVCQFCWSSHWPQLRRKHETATLKMKIMRIMRFIHSDASALFARGYYLQLSELIKAGAATCSIIFQISYNFWPHDL